MPEQQTDLRSPGHADRLRRKTRQLFLRNVPIGGDAPITVQSMTNTDTRDVRSTIEQIRRLQDVGCEIVRVAVPDMEAAKALGVICRAASIPVVADIHFDHRLALEAIAQGVDGLRINPGNIGGRRKVRELVRHAVQRGVPIRIGVNSGSLERHILEAEGGVTPNGMVQSALHHVGILEEMGFRQIKISLKAADVRRTFEAYRLISERVDYPLHLGITEAGTPFYGTIKSAVGLGILLHQGIGDTIRVSLTASPEEEVRVAYGILRALGLRHRGIEMISCPTCGRTQMSLIPVALEVERRLAHISLPLQVAVMGCVVNGPGEAREADLGICGGKTGWLMFRKGNVIKRLKPDLIVEEFVEEVEAEARSRGWQPEKDTRESDKNLGRPS
jgi:(E)-4-hydroxy-3-methylbut-2-enyl-diphosphate synthase